MNLPLNSKVLKLYTWIYIFKQVATLLHKKTNCADEPFLFQNLNFGQTSFADDGMEKHDFSTTLDNASFYIKFVSSTQHTTFKYWTESSIIMLKYAGK